MRTRTWVAGAAVCAAMVSAVVLFRDGKPVTAAEGAEHDFGKKVLIVATKPTDVPNQAGGTYIEDAKVRKLGDRLFLVGKVPDLGEAFHETKGTVIWTPISEVVQISEYADTETLKKILDAAGQADKAK